MQPTNEQLEVITSKEKYILVNACAGSGKTQTLVERCRALPMNDFTLVMAFNKAAQQEFDGRIAGRVSRTTVRTFHSFCLQQIRSNPSGFGYMRAPILDTDTGQFKLMNAANKTSYHSWERSPWSQDFIQSAQHSKYDEDLHHIIKNNRPPIDWEELNQYKIEHLIETGQKKFVIGDEQTGFQIDDPDGEADIPEDLMDLEDNLREYYSCKGLLRLREWLQDNNVVIFDEMIRVVAENRQYLQPIADHIMIDEFQDVDRFQFDIIKELGAADRVKSIACVGDPCQLIYEWRGALGNAFESFAGTFPNTKTYELKTNFRSVDCIIDEANKVFDKGMKGVKGKKKDSVMSSGQIGESTPAPELLKDVHPSRYKNLAVLCRTNRSVAQWNINLSKQGIPVNVIGKQDFWGQQHVQLAEVARRRRVTEGDLFASETWAKIMKTKKFRRNEDARKDAEEDAKFVLELTDQDYSVMRKSMSNKEGVRISTIHKTKGMEFDRVLIANVDEPLKQEKCLYYVAITRAKERLIYG